MTQMNEKLFNTHISSLNLIVYNRFVDHWVFWARYGLEYKSNFLFFVHFNAWAYMGYPNGYKFVRFGSYGYESTFKLNVLFFLF